MCHKDLIKSQQKKDRQKRKQTHVLWHGSIRLQCVAYSEMGTVILNYRSKMAGLIFGHDERNSPPARSENLRTRNTTNKKQPINKQTNKLKINK